MKTKQFNELLEGVREMGAIMAGKERSARKQAISPLKVKRIRAKYSASQSEFALMLGVPLKTLQKWEQGNRKPSGPAAALLRIADANPRVFKQALSPKLA
jgi:putative transcriptional regulator